MEDTPQSNHKEIKLKLIQILIEKEAETMTV
jgi:hypothetical protein